MNDVKLIRTLKEKLKNESLTFKWWVLKYLPDHKYQYINSQINGFHTMQDYTRNAIKRFLQKDV